MPILACESLTMRFGGLAAVCDLSFSVEPGEIRGVIGPNGAGKTTLFNLISGFYRPHSGRVIYNGDNIAGMRTPDIAARGLVRTFQHSALFRELTLTENVLVGGHLRQRPGFFSSVLGLDRERREENMERAIKALEFFGLSGRRNDRAGELPHGLQRILGVAVAMAAEPKTLLLDEPFTGMNPEETLRMMALTRKIRDRGVTILLVEHDMRAVMGLCGRVTVVNFGRLLFEGPPDEIREHPEVIEAYLGARDAV